MLIAAPQDIARTLEGNTLLCLKMPIFNLNNCKVLVHYESGLFEIVLCQTSECTRGVGVQGTVQIIIPFEGARYQVDWTSQAGARVSHLLGAGDILVIPNNQSFTTHWQRTANILSLKLSTEFLEQVLDRQGLDLREGLIIRDRFLSSAAIELRRAAAARDLSSKLLGAFAAMVAFKVGRNAENQNGRSGGPVRPLSAGERARVEKFVSENLDRPIRIAELAGLVGLSHWRFLRRFAATEGVGPAAFIIQRRIERACTLLTQSTLSVTDVALETGMSPSHLSRTFLKIMGVSPRVFRQRSGS